MTEHTQPDVTVIGFGPVGATLAGLLGRRGLSVVVIERDAEVFPLPRAAHIDHTGLRTIQELGLTDDLMASMIPNPGLDFVNADRRVLMQIPGNQGSVSGLPASLYFHQPGFDRALRHAASSVPGVEVRLGHEMVGVREDGGSVTVTIEGPDGGYELRTPWLVGCDGASSPVRETLSMRLENLKFDEQWLVIDLLLDAPVDTLPDHAVHVCDPARPHTAIPMPNGRYRFEFTLLEGEDPEEMRTQERIDELLRFYMPPGTARLERGAVYWFHGLVAEDWRRGRVFLAGDAAHQMPPFLGQGMCSGIRDASNLAWKLALCARGHATDELLDTYGTERGPHVRAVVQAALDFGAIIGTRDPETARARDERLLANNGSPAAGKAFALARLTPGPLVLTGGGALFPQPVLTDGTRLDDHVGARFLVVGTDARALDAHRAWWERAIDAHVVSLADLPGAEPVIQRWLDRHEVTTVVVRPDRYVMWAGTNLDEAEAALRSYLPAVVSV